MTFKHIRYFNFSAAGAPPTPAERAHQLFHTVPWVEYHIDSSFRQIIKRAMWTRSIQGRKLI